MPICSRLQLRLPLRRLGPPLVWRQETINKPASVRANDRQGSTTLRARPYMTLFPKVTFTKDNVLSGDRREAPAPRPFVLVYDGRYTADSTKY